METYGGAAIYISNNSSVTVQNCTIENNNIGQCNGISISGSNGSRYIYNNVIRNNSNHGISIVNSGNAYLRYNTITGLNSPGKASVYCDYFSTPLFAVPAGGYEEGRNTLQNGYYGLYGFYYCNISAGSQSIAYNNRFLNNSYANAYASYNTTIYAQYDWWGQAPPNTSKIIAVNGSTIYYTPYLESDPGGGALIKVAGDGDGSNEINNFYSTNEFLAENSKIEIAQLWKIYQETRDGNIISELKQIISDKNDPDLRRPIAMEVLSNIYIFDKNEKEAITLNDELIVDYKGTIHEKNGLLNLFFIHYDAEDFASAEKALLQIDNSYSTEDRVMLAQWLLRKDDLGKSSDEDILSLSLEYNLIQNYPNPFNPSTQIKFSILKDGFVTLKVYDILGREIAELVNEEKFAGTYSVSFNASNLASGIYFYSINAGKFNQVKKMILLR